ncbi:MAG TPA: radical SAM protein [Flavobacterium sp.]|jgi:molybdenum cofactor biosynthesis enzyme MoaA
MDIYKLLKVNQYVKNHRIKFLGLWLLSVMNKRYLAVQLDPVLACNLRCKMCYFTDEDFVRKNMKGAMKEEDIAPLAKTIFKNALKLQIGCGAEPALFKHNVKLIQAAKEYKVPYISMITNGNLFDKTDIANLSDAGLDEIILSMHGVRRETYEDLMARGDYDKFHSVLQHITDQKQRNPSLRLRINYTFNQDNFYELEQFFERFGSYSIDIIQLRPIDKIGETTYNEFSLKKIESDYVRISTLLKTQAATRNITLLYPQSVVRNEAESLKVHTQNDSSYLVPYTYCYVSPKYFWKDDFDWKSETFNAWKKRSHWDAQLLKNVFTSRKALSKLNRNMLNYSVDLN